MKLDKLDVAVITGLSILGVLMFIFPRACLAAVSVALLGHYWAKYNERLIRWLRGRKK